MIIDPILLGKVCPYCGKESELIDSAEIYNGISYGLMFICRDCDAYVGCYTGTDKSMGRLANKDLRAAKKRAHHYLDQLWDNPHKRQKIYWKLSQHLGIDKEITHIGMSDIEQCNKIIEWSINKLREKGIEYKEYVESK